MKILVLQLARLGDIYQSWPVLAALKRNNPGAELHLLTRSKFAMAAKDLALVDKQWLLDTRDILMPLIDEHPAIDTSLGKLGEFVSQVRAENFDRVINLSFSPFSSYLTREVTGAKSVVSGYTRFDDGYLNIPDDGSAYFYGQVGVGKPNRLHVTDLFAYVAGVELTEEDWSLAPQHEDACEPGDAFIVIHVGASAAAKTLSASKWQQVARGLLQNWHGSVVLVGAKEEEDVANQVAALSGERRPINLVGKTSLTELMAILKEARLLIGGDSGPVQIATLVNTPVLNISLPMVSFWETGPRSKGSRILPVASEGEISAEEIVDEALAMTKGQFTKRAVIRVPSRTFPFLETRPQPQAFEWELIRGMYMGADFPLPPSKLFISGLERLADVNNLALEQIAALRKDRANKTASLILDRVDDLMNHILEMVGLLAPIVSWFRTERLRIGPMPIEPLIDATEAVHVRLRDVIDIYLKSDLKREPAEELGATREPVEEDEGDDIILG